MQVDRSEVLDIFRQSHIFHSLTDTQIETVIDRVEAFLYDENQVLFDHGGPSDSLYFVVSGRVQIIRKRKSAEETAILEARDYFGEESLATNPVQRRVKAVALSELIVLRLAQPVIEKLREEFPQLALPMRVVVSSYLLTMELKMEWRAPREVVHFISRRHWIFLILKLIPALLIGGLFSGVGVYLSVVVFPQSNLPVILLGVILFLLLLWLGWLVLDWSNDYAVVTNRRVVKLEKVLLIYESRQEVPLDAILADDLKTDQFGRMLDYGSIMVRTYTGVMVLDRLSHPQMIINLINEVRGRKKVKRRSQQIDEIDRTIRSRIEQEPEEKKVPGDADVPVHFKAGGLQEFMSKLFLLRYEENGNIVYRTHWYLLIKRTGIPLLAAFFLLAAVILIWFNIIPFGAQVGTLLFLILGPAVFIWLVYQYVDWRNDRYIITPELIIDVFKKPLGTEEKKSAPLRNILSIDYERKNLLALILNFGTVFVRVGESTFTFNNVVNPAEVQREIFQSFMSLKQRDEARQEQERSDQMADWIERYHRYMTGATQPNPYEEAGESDTDHASGSGEPQDPHP